MLTRKGENAPPSTWQNGTAFDLTAVQCFWLLPCGHVANGVHVRWLPRLRPATSPPYRGAPTVVALAPRPRIDPGTGVQPLS